MIRELRAQSKSETETGRRVIPDGSQLPLMEAFYTLQGEGTHSGRAAFFIRLGGCDVGCVWCDVKESWNADHHPVVSVDAIAASALQHPCRLAVITGGEPLMYELDTLTTALHRVGFATHLETSGSHPLSGRWDWICLSPKKFKPALPEVFERADELKVVVYNRSDLKWAEDHALRVSDRCILLLQPEWSRRQQVMPLIIEHIKANPRWRISLQCHKYMDIP